MSEIPGEMRALQIERYQTDAVEALCGLRVVKKEVPKPSHGQVLVMVEAAPCNPSDLLFLQGRYGKGKTLPAIPGWEGAGTVVAAGGGLMARWLLGKRVAFSNQTDSGGTWAQYCLVDAKTCIVLKRGVSSEQGACMIINPLTAVGLVERAVEGGHQAIVQTAAASQLGRMVIALAKEKGIPVINVIRRMEQADLLKGLGVEFVLNSASPYFYKELKEKAHQLRATIAFDAVGGTMTGQMLSVMPDRSKILVYGALSGANCGDIGPLSLIFQEKVVEGFFLGAWIREKGFWGMYQATNKVQRLLASGTFHTAISARATLDEAPEALISYQRDMTSGKVLLIPNEKFA